MTVTDNQTISWVKGSVAIRPLARLKLDCVLQYKQGHSLMVRCVTLAL